MELKGLITKYAILTRRTDLLIHVSADVPGDNISAERSLCAEAGTFIKVFQTQSASDIVGNGKLSTVQVLNFEQHDPIYENLYECPQRNLCKVPEGLWPFMISITDPERRIRLLQNNELNRYIEYLKINSLVSVSGELFRNDALRFDCIVRYIGPVVELHPVGYFFGLELLDLQSGYSPQQEEIPFAKKYMECSRSLSIFTSAEWISPLSVDAKKKFSAYDIISGTLEKVRTVIGPTSFRSGVDTSTPVVNRKAKRPPKKKTATARFYHDTPALTTNAKETNVLSDINAYHDNRTQVESMDRTSQSGNADSQAPVDIRNEEFTKSIENYEKNLERKHAGGATSDTHIPNRSQSPAGILKHHRTATGGIGADTNNLANPLTIMSLKDRDIVVIDKSDIRESMKNEASVIVVDKTSQADIELADLLCGNWPQIAGEAALILSKGHKSKSQEQKSSAGVAVAAMINGSGASSDSSVNSLRSVRSDRNKSPNFLVALSPSGLKDNCHTVAQRSTTDNMKVAIGSSFASAGDAKSSRPLYAFIAGELPAAAVLEQEYVGLRSPLQQVPNTDLDVGSMVEVSIAETPVDVYGVIRWIGQPPNTESIIVGVELDDDQTNKELPTSNGSYNDVLLFKCHEGRALFVKPEQCSKDRRFLDVAGAADEKANDHPMLGRMFGQVECPPVAGAVAPLKIFNLDDLEQICGKFKGIQGHHNSCYLDATLFAMFTFTSVFDSLLFRPAEVEDIQHYSDVQKVLREEIVNPLRKNVFVRADRVMKLRQLLDKLSSVSGLTSEEKDPEEFLNSMLAQIMRVEPFLKLSSGQDAYFYQLFVEKDERLSFPSVQQLFEQSFHSSDIKLKEVPSCLIIQMPRFGKNYKMYPRILPSQELDVTDIIEDSPRQCSMCGMLAETECRDCFGMLQTGNGLECTAFCRKCLEKVHMHPKRANHSFKKLSAPQDFCMMAEHMTVPRLYMELFAVVCIETSHYVAFVKAGSGPDAPWCFFDSMADRKGEQNGYNIPEMRTVPDMTQWLSEEGARTINETSCTDKMLPEHAKRLFCDAYMCMYQSTDVMMYR